MENQPLQRTTEEAQTEIGKLIFGMIVDLAKKTAYGGLITTVEINGKKFKITVEDEDVD